MAFDIAQTRKTVALFRELIAAELGADQFNQELAYNKARIISHREKLLPKAPGVTYMDIYGLLEDLVDLGPEPANDKDTIKTIAFIAAFELTDWEQGKEGLNVELSIF